MGIGALSLCSLNTLLTEFIYHFTAPKRDSGEPVSIPLLASALSLVFSLRRRHSTGSGGMVFRNAGENSHTSCVQVRKLAVATHHCHTERDQLQGVEHLKPPAPPPPYSPNSWGFWANFWAGSTSWIYKWRHRDNF